MFRCLLLFVVLFFVCPVFAANDSALIVNGISDAAKVAEFIANISGHSAISQAITLIVAAVVPVVAFIIGHIHGKASAKIVAGK